MTGLAIIGVTAFVASVWLGLTAAWLAWSKRDGIPALIAVNLCLAAAFIAFMSILAGRLMS